MKAELENYSASKEHTFMRQLTITKAYRLYPDSIQVMPDFNIKDQRAVSDQKYPKG